MATQIRSGVFAGVEVPSGDLVLITDHSGSLMEWWPVHSRTPLFLERFPPRDGWAIEISTSPGAFNLPDYRNVPAVGSEDALIQPTALFVVSLKREGQIVNQASSLEVIDGPKAWERGETNARGRLYDALGLPGAIRTLVSSSQAEPEKVQPASPVPVVGEDTPKATPPQVATEQSAIPTNAKAMKSDAVEANLRQQITSMAAIKGVEVPPFKGLDEAKAFYKDLLMGRITA